MMVSLLTSYSKAMIYVQSTEIGAMKLWHYIGPLFIAACVVVAAIISCTVEKVFSNQGALRKHFEYEELFIIL